MRRMERDSRNLSNTTLYFFKIYIRERLDFPQYLNPYRYILEYTDVTFKSHP